MMRDFDKKKNISSYITFNIDGYLIYKCEKEHSLFSLNEGSLITV